MARTQTTPNNNFTATSAPAVTDDASKGYTVGSQWINLTTDTVYELTDSTVGAALWVVLGTTGTAGDVTGPASAVDSNLVAFNGTTGKLIKDSGSSITTIQASIDAKVTAPVTAQNSIVFFGDSITANFWAGATSITLTRSANTVTATYASHPFMVGQTFLVEQATDSTYNGKFVVVSRPDANSFTYTNAGANGSTTGLLRNPYWQADNGWVTWARGFLGNRLLILYNAGIGGNTTTQMLARITTDVTSYNPQWVSVFAGINDIIAGSSAASILTNLLSIYTQLNALDIKVIAMTVLPLEIGHTSYSVANNEKIQAINFGIKTYCKQNPVMYFVDSYKTIVDPNSATGQPLTGYLSTDHIHPSGIGSLAIGREFADILDDVMPEVNTLPDSASDNRVTSATNTNLWNWLPSTASGGTVGGTATGSPPTGIKVDSFAGSPIVTATGFTRTVQNDGDSIGYNASMTITAQAASNAAEITHPGGTWDDTAVTGKAYYLECTIDAIGVSGSNLSKLYAQFTQRVDSVNYNAYTPQGTGNAFPTTDFKIVVQTPPFFLQGTTVNSFTWSVNAIFSALGTPVTINVGRIQVRELPAGTTLYY